MPYRVFGASPCIWREVLQITSTRPSIGQTRDSRRPPPRARGGSRWKFPLYFNPLGPRLRLGFALPRPPSHGATVSPLRSGNVLNSYFLLFFPLYLVFLRPCKHYSPEIGRTVRTQAAAGLLLSKHGAYSRIFHSKFKCNSLPLVEWAAVDVPASYDTFELRYQHPRHHAIPAADCSITGLPTCVVYRLRHARHPHTRLRAYHRRVHPRFHI